MQYKSLLFKVNYTTTTPDMKEKVEFTTQLYDIK